MKFNISYPATGCQKCIEIDDERKLRTVYDMRMAQEVEGGKLGDEFAGYIFRITGGNDKQGFAMKQGILLNTRVRLLLHGGASCYRQRKAGERKRKSVRGCIVGPDISVLNLTVVKKGDAEVAGLTDDMVPRRLGPKPPPKSASSSTWRRPTTCASAWSSAPSPTRRARRFPRAPRSSAW